jgi:hypothetical protein
VAKEIPPASDRGRPMRGDFDVSSSVAQSCCRKLKKPASEKRGDFLS